MTKNKIWCFICKKFPAKIQNFQKILNKKNNKKNCIYCPPDVARYSSFAVQCARRPNSLIASSPRPHRLPLRRFAAPRSLFGKLAMRRWTRCGAPNGGRRELWIKRGGGGESERGGGVESMGEASGVEGEKSGVFRKFCRFSWHFSFFGVFRIWAGNLKLKKKILLWAGNLKFIWSFSGKIKKKFQFKFEREYLK